MPSLKKLSKFLALVLRHRADRFGVDLDEDGYADLEVIRSLIKKTFKTVYSEEHLQKVIESSRDGRKRFEVKDNRIRARYGHSQLRIDYPPIEPPELLYHGTHKSALPAIRANGLQSMSRKYVHLSSTPNRAAEVGFRRSRQPIILTILAKKAFEAGHTFHQAEEAHYLCRYVPVDFIEIEE